MSLTAAPFDHLHARLLAQFARETPAGFSCVRAQRRHSVSSMQIDAPLLALPLRGVKTVRHGGRRIDIAPGELMVVSAPCALDLEHLPDAATGEYLTAAVTLCDAVLEAARHLHGGAAAVRATAAAPLPVGRASAQPLVPALLRWCDAVDRRDEVDARLALTDVVLQLVAQGHAALLSPPLPTLAARIRAMVSEAPARPWPSAEVEARVGMSGATLRRRLADEHTSLRAVISDARLASGMQLLYTTRLPVKTVAQRVGYASASSFGKRFAERYGLEPSRIGNEMPPPRVPRQPPHAAVPHQRQPADIDAA